VWLVSKTVSFISPFHSFAPNQQPDCKSQDLSWDSSLHNGLSDASPFWLSQCALSRQTPSFSKFQIFTPEAGLFVTSSNRFCSQLFWHQFFGSLLSLSGTAARTVKTEVRRENWVRTEMKRCPFRQRFFFLFPFPLQHRTPWTSIPSKSCFW
jgi:hypothetical protein